MEAKELHKQFTSAYPFVGLSLQVVKRYLKKAKRPSLDDLFDYAVSQGLIEDEIEL